jgi:two-component system, response regulator YesN
MKIILVDDESIILTGISTMIKKVNLNWEVAAECTSGEEALQVIDEISPDVVISDIRMYGISGIDLAESIREKHKDTLVILLTGYAEFNYAHQAIKLNIFDYLLKPTRYDDILNCLSRAEEYLENKKKKQTLYAALTSRLEDSKETLRDKFLLDLMKGLLPVSTNIPVKLEEYGLNIEQFVVLNVCCTAVGDGFGSGSEDKCLLNYGVKNILGEVLGPLRESEQLIFLTENLQNFVVVAAGGFPQEDGGKKLRNRLARAADLLEKILGVHICVGCSGQGKDIKDLFDCYNQSSYALNQTVKQNCKMVFFRDLEYEIPQNKYSDSIKSAVKYIDQNYQNDITLKEVAETVYLNIWYLSDLFKREVGVTFGEYVQNRRIEKAKELLHDQTLKLYEVAYRVGIKEQGYFSNLFKKATGVSPKKYREQIKNR